MTSSADSTLPFPPSSPPGAVSLATAPLALSQLGGLLGGLRVGEGWDCHALVPGRALVLGGVTVPHSHGLLGHSDADVLLHAITDESSAMELHGYSPRLVMGSPEKIKLTYPTDFALAEAILKERAALAV